jgi:hypothetical protein
MSAANDRLLLVRCSCLLLSLLVVALLLLGFCTKFGLQAYDRRAQQRLHGMLWLSVQASAGCSVRVCMQGPRFVHDAGKTEPGASDRIDANRCISFKECSAALALCSCGCLQSILVTAVCTGCAACLETGTACKVHYTDATLSNRCSDVC